MSFFEAIKQCFVKYNDITGRASRSEFFYFHIFCFSINIFFYIYPNPILPHIISIGLFAPVLSVNIRRLHDIGKNGKELLWFFLPVIGWFYLLLLFCQPGDINENAYGKNPLVK